MGMTIKEIIDGLQFTIDMFLFNPSTGEIQPKHLLNEDSRLTVDACEGAIDTMRKYQKIEQILKEPCIIPEGCYPMLKKIKRVMEDGNDK